LQFIWRYLYAVLGQSVEGRPQDVKAHDGQSSTSPAAEEPVALRDGPLAMSGVQDATDVAVEDDIAQDEDGRISVLYELGYKYALHLWKYDQ